MSLRNATKQHNQHKIVLAIVGVALANLLIEKEKNEDGVTMKTTKNRGGSRSNLNPRHKNEAKNLNHLNYHNQAARKHKRRLANTKVKMQVMKKNKTKEKKISFYLKLGKYKKFKFM